MTTQAATYASVIGVVVSEERERKGLTQAAAAKDAGLPQSTWARIEVGRACTFENLARATQALEVELWELIKVVDDRVRGLRDQGIQVVFELPSEKDVKSNPHQWLTGSSLRTLSIVGLGTYSGVAVAGITPYISEVLGNLSKEIDKLSKEMDQTEGSDAGSGRGNQLSNAWHAFKRMQARQKDNNSE